LMGKSEVFVHRANGQELDPEMIKCHVCRDYA
jgi:hypothetical protein